MFKEKSPCAFAVLGFVLFIAAFRVGNVKAQTTAYPANSIWVDPGGFVFDKDNGSIGTMFNLTVWVSTNDSSFTWEAGIHFNTSLFQVTSVGLTAGGTSEFFQGHTTAAVIPVIDNASGEVLFGETLLSNDSVAAGNGSLMWTTFEIIAAPNSTSTSFGNYSIDVDDESYVLGYDLNMMNLTGKFGATYLFSYLGDTIPPTITNVTQIPANGNVLPDEDVTVLAKVTDDFGGSGVANVTLSYSKDNVTFTDENMALNVTTRLWAGVIPGYSVGTTVYYVIYASDNAGNVATRNSNSENWSYTVMIPEFPSSLLIVTLFAMATTLLVVLKKSTAKQKHVFC